MHFQLRVIAVSSYHMMFKAQGTETPFAKGSSKHHDEACLVEQSQMVEEGLRQWVLRKNAAKT
jgi:hypothetical protein